jgi:hypothetical protein
MTQDLSLTRRRSISVFYAQGPSYQALHAQNLANKHLWAHYAANTSFRFLVSAFLHTISHQHQVEVMESFDYMNFQGKIEMKNPEIILGCFEECMIYLCFSCTLRDFIVTRRFASRGLPRDPPGRTSSPASLLRKVGTFCHPARLLHSYLSHRYDIPELMDLSRLKKDQPDLSSKNLT